MLIQKQYNKLTLLEIQNELKVQTQLHKIDHEEEFWVDSQDHYLPLTENVLEPLTKSVLIPLGLTASDAAIHNKMLGSAIRTLIISNEEIKNIMKI